MLLIQVNQVQAMEAKDPANKIVPEEVVTKDVADKADEVGASTALHINHQSGTSREKWEILSRS